jgi:hypothetical protein
MNLLIWLDLPLMVLGLLAMSPGLWSAFYLRRAVCRSAFGRGVRTATVLVFYLGLGTLAVGGIDAGLAEWEQTHRPRGNDASRVSMMAPDFSLPLLDQDRTVRLSDFRGQKPVVLIFGNFY